MPIFDMANSTAKFSALRALSEQACLHGTLDLSSLGAALSRLVDCEHTVLQAHARALHDTTRSMPQIRVQEDQDLLPFPAGSLEMFKSTFEGEGETIDEGTQA